MSEQNKELIRRFYAELVNQRKMAVADEIISPDFNDHAASGRGLAHFKSLYASMTAIFPDIQVSIEDLVAEDDKVAARVEVTATQAKSFRGFPSADKQVTYSGMDLFRIEDGKIVERWTQRDFLGMLEKLGHIQG